MIGSCITISLVEEARGGPFVFWHDLPAAIRQAAELGFDAVEIFPPAPEAIDVASFRRLLQDHGLKLAAVGTGAGWVRQRLHLTSADPEVRQQARQFIAAIIDRAGEFRASAIIGSMQGRWGDSVGRDQALNYLGEALNDLGERANRYGVPLLYEPLNRYETNLINTVADGVRLLQSLSGSNVKLLADLFHMNIEEVDLAAALRTGGQYIGHVHFVDSNRRPPGCGHLDFSPVAAALREIQYQGYVSAEALPYPDSERAAAQVMAAYREHFSAPTS